MRTFIHIGQHKTGTTSIQNALVKNRGLLIQRGLYYPEELLGERLPSHYALNIYALHENRFSPKKVKMFKGQNREALKWFNKQLVNTVRNHYKQAESKLCKEVLWSNEGLYLLNSEAEYQKLFDLFQPYSDEIICVCCFRDPDSYRSSYINQLKKSGFDTTQNKESFCYTELDSWLFDYERKMDLLKRVFGEHVINFEYQASGMVNKFMKQIGHAEINLEELKLNLS